ncbi:hypothetical protein ACTTAI_05310 [Rhodobacter capsulatus]|uniref:hypothetical protein n=1 Tax=Rhodobacter capsulatus TaxID=1061 RepID=UPI004024FE0F
MAIRCRSEALAVLLMLALVACKPGGESGKLQGGGPEAVAEARAACEGKGGQWARLGKMEYCITRTKDAGKSCHSRSECDGECLARSMTCAPAKPLLGCNAVLTEGGIEVNQCVE